MTLIITSRQATPDLTPVSGAAARTGYARRHMRIAANRVASALFTCSALAPLGVWFILLFVATPMHQPVLQSALQTGAYVFSESPAPWFFAALAALPRAFAVLAVAAWRAPARAWGLNSGLTVLAISSIALAMFVIWEVAFFAGPATYLLVGQRDG